MKAFLEKNEKEWFDDYVYTSRQPLLDRGIEVVGFDGNNFQEFIERNYFHEDDVLIGCVDTTIAFWNQLGILVPGYIGYPDSLLKYMKRKIISATFYEVGSMEFPLFIKPKNDVKLFTGFVIENKKSYDNCKFLYKEITDDLELYVSEVTSMLSEYRCFVHKSKLVGIKHYDGDFSLFPNIETINKMIDDYTNAPVSYTLDVAVNLDDTVLIEVNDFWAIGGYGLDGKLYTRMLIDRFQEIKKTKKIDIY